MSGQVFLTFDDGPDIDWTPQILDLLAEAGAQATFFVIGEQVRIHTGLARRIRAAGHDLGNHTLSHRHPFSMSVRRARLEVSEGARAIADVTGEAVKYFRPPHGRIRRCMVEEAAALGEELVLWDVSAIDWGLLGSRQGIARRLGRIREGSIALMHDGRNGINRNSELVAALPGFLAGLARQDLKPCLLSLKASTRA